MAEKSIDEKILDLNEQIKKLEKERYDLEHPHAEYPKYLADARRTVANEKEEKEVLAAVAKDEKVAPISADEKLQADRVRAQDEEETKYRVSRAQAEAKHVPLKDDPKVQHKDRR